MPFRLDERLRELRSKVAAVRETDLRPVFVELKSVLHQRTMRLRKAGAEYTIDLVPKVKLEMVLTDDQVDSAVGAILKTASTGKIGDGKIFLSKVEEVIRIRNQERGVVAL